MRGLLLLGLGATLIWLGVQSASRKADASGTDVHDEGGFELDPEPVLQGEEDTPLPEEVSPPQAPPPMEDDGAVPQRAAAPIGEPREVTVEPAEGVGELTAPARRDAAQVVADEPERYAAPAFELGAPGGEPAFVAERLLDAWLARDPAPLQVWLNDAENDVPMARRQLVASFWQAAAGTPEGVLEAVARLEGSGEVSAAEIALLRAAADPEPHRPVPATAGRRDPLARAMRMVLLDQGAHARLERGELAAAARAASDLLHLELEAPWPPHRDALLGWVDLLNRAQAKHRLSPEGDWPGVEVVVKPGDNLTDLRVRFLREHPGAITCVGLIRTVNHLGEYIHPGDVLRVPTDPPNVLVDLDARLCVYRHGSEAVLAWTVGIGMEGQETPLGVYVVGDKQPNPSWMPHGSEPLPFGHPDNPLGTRWIAWHAGGEKTSYGFHGTWEPDGVGGRVSRGCVRMRNEDVEVLYELLPVGARVTVQP